MAGSLQPHFLGKIVEICIVTADHRRTIEGLLRFGIGPFRIHTFNASCVQSQKYYGQPTEFELQVCFATQGAVVWEIMQPVSGLSVMADFLAKHGEGIHHVAFDCDQVPVQQRRDEFAKRGFQIAQEGVWQGKRGTCHFMFWDTEDATTTCFETYHFSSDWVDPNDTEWYPSPPTKVSTLLTDPQSTAGHPAGNDKGIIRASKGKGIVLAKGQCLKVINTHGKQVIDFFAFALDSRLQPPTAAALEFLSMQHTRSGNLHINPRAGSTLFSNLRKPMFTFVEDTSPGIHDSLVPACDPERYRQLGAQGHHASCAQNLEMTLAEAGYSFPGNLMPAPLNLWMNVPVGEEGQLAFVEPVSSEGDYVMLKAEQNCLAICSACPQDMTLVNGYLQKPADCHYEVFEAELAQ